MNSSPHNEYVFFGGKRTAMDTVTGTGGGSIGTTYYYAEDFLGSSRAMLQAGATSACFDADFLPFGREKDAVATCTQNAYKFEGKERDAETGNDDFGARYYSSNFGRWLSPDWSSVPAPVPYANLTNPQTLNLYAMVQDNPESFADLDGHVISPKATNGVCNTVTMEGCDDWEQSQIWNNRLSAASKTPDQMAAFIDFWDADDEPYALTFTPSDPTKYFASLGGPITYITPGISFNGQRAFAIVNLMGYATRDAQGNITSETEVTTTAYFAYEQQNGGQFLGGTQSSTTFSPNSPVVTSSPSESLDFLQATRFFGTDAMAFGANVGAGGQDAGAHFPAEVAKDARAHPVKYLLHAIGFALPFAEIPEAVEGIITAGEALHTASDLNKEARSGANP